MMEIEPLYKVIEKSLKVYVVCSESEKAGIDHGVWIEACAPAWEINSKIKKMLSNSAFKKVEEYEIEDCNLLGVNLDKYTSVGRISEVGMFLHDFGQEGANLLMSGMDFDDAVRKLKN